MNKNLIPALLLTAAAIGILGCEGSANDPKNTETDTKTQTVSETKAETEISDYSDLSLLERLRLNRDAIPDNLPEVSYGGYEFKTTPFDVDRLRENTNRDILDEASYQRIAAIEERFDIHIVDVPIPGMGDYDAALKGLTTAILSDTNAYDLVQVPNTMISVLTTNGMVLDLSEIESIDFSKPWFYQEADRQFSYKNHHFCSISNAGNIFAQLACIYFNKKLVEKYDFEDLYDVVRDGRWTLDYLKTLTHDKWNDLNGDGKRVKEDDEFALLLPDARFSTNGLPSFLVTLIGKDAEDMPFLNPDNDPAYIESVYSDMRDFILNDTGVTTGDNWGPGEFKDGRAMFYMGMLGDTGKYLRDINFSYGILPMVKYSENQKDYYSSFLPDPFVIPTCTADAERSGVIMSALATYGYKMVAPAYFETTVKDKYADDENTVEMLDIIANNVMVDGAIMFTKSRIYVFFNFLKTEQEFPSYWESIKNSVNYEMDNILKALDEKLGE